MTAPLSVNAQAHTEVEVNDSCNCCFPRKSKRKDAKTVVVTEEVFLKKVIQVETPEFRAVGSAKGSHKGHRGR